jgi:CRP-like cAMP-binding protein
MFRLLGWHAAGFMIPVMSPPSSRICGDCPVAQCGRDADGACLFVERHQPRGALVCIEGTPATHVWLIKRGAVLLSRSGDDTAAARGPHAVRRAGAFVGLEALIRPTYRETARVTAPSVLCGATLDVVDRWLGPPGSPPRVALEQTLRATCDDLPRAASPDGTARQRVARWLLREAAHGAAALPRQDVAGLLGLVPETLSRSLARLATTGAIAVDRRHIRILDLEAVRAAAVARPRR